MMIWIVSGVLLFASMGLWPISVRYSQAELERQMKRRVSGASRASARAQQYIRLATIVSLAQLLFMALFILLGIWRFGWGWGIAIAAAGVLLFGVFRPAMRRIALSRWLYGRIELHLLRFSMAIERATPWLEPVARPSKLGSKQDLFEYIERSPEVLSEPDGKRLRQVLSYYTKTARGAMRSWETVKTVKKSELLGPLVLDELHRTGEVLFPVMHGKKVVGMLDISHLTTLDNKQSPTTHNVMGEAATVADTTRLDAVLATFATSRHTVLVVTDNDEQPVGMVFLEDVLKYVTGQSYTSTGEGR